MTHADVGREYSFLGSVRVRTLSAPMSERPQVTTRLRWSPVMKPDRHTVPHTRVSLPLIQNFLVLPALEEFITDLEMIEIPDQKTSAWDEDSRLLC